MRNALYEKYLFVVDLWLCQEWAEWGILLHICARQKHQEYFHDCYMHETYGSFLPALWGWTTKKIPRSCALWTNLLNCWGGTFLMFVWLLFLPSCIYTSESLRNQKKSSAGRTSTHFQRFTKLSYYVGYSNWITTQNLLKFAYLSRICYSI